MKYLQRFLPRVRFQGVRLAFERKLAPWLKSHSFHLSLLATLPLAAGILFLSACVQHPVGDPEYSRVDARFAGIWIRQEAKSGGEQSVLILHPYDSRTFLAKLLAYQTVDGVIQPAYALDFKAWMKSLGDDTFITMQLLGAAQLLGAVEARPYLVAKIELQENSLRLRMVDGEQGPAREAQSRLEMESIVFQHAADAGLYQAATATYRRLTDRPELERILRAFKQR